MVPQNISVHVETVGDTPLNLSLSHFLQQSHISLLSPGGPENCVSQVHCFIVTNDGEWRCCLYVPYFMGQEGTERRTFPLGSGYCLLAFSVFRVSFYFSLTRSAQRGLLNQWGDMSWLT